MVLGASGSWSAVLLTMFLYWGQISSKPTNARAYCAQASWTPPFRGRFGIETGPNQEIDVRSMTNRCRTDAKSTPKEGSGLHPNPSLTKPVILIFLIFDPQNMQNMRIKAAHAAKHREKKQNSSRKNGKCRTCYVWTVSATKNGDEN